MPTQQRIKTRIDRTRDLQSVVSTMKALAAVNIRQYEKAAESVDVFNRTVELALQVVLKSVPSSPSLPRPETGVRIAVVIGSDQGMCGRFNEDIVHLAEKRLPEMAPREAWTLVTVGARPASLLQLNGWTLAASFQTPGSTAALSTLVQDILYQVGYTDGLAAVVVLHNHHVSGTSYEPAFIRLLPLDREWVERFRNRDWPGPSLPLTTMDRDDLFTLLVRQYLFVSLYRALAHSLAGENASRLAAMQAAESNIDERLDTLTSDYHRQRQQAITEELLDIVSGFEVLTP